MVEPRTLRTRGTFNLRPTGIAFDLLFQWNGGWQIHHISILPFSTAGAPASPR
jgi:hypothetical protein